MTLGGNETRRYSPVRHFKCVADDIARGVADAIAASNLLEGIRNEEVSLGQLQVSLSAIEKVAGRKINEPIVD